MVGSRCAANRPARSSRGCKRLQICPKTPFGRKTLPSRGQRYSLSSGHIRPHRSLHGTRVSLKYSFDTRHRQDTNGRPGGANDECPNDELVVSRVSRPSHLTPTAGLPFDPFARNPVSQKKPGFSSGSSKPPPAPDSPGRAARSPSPPARRRGCSGFDDRPFPSGLPVPLLLLLQLSLFLSSPLGLFLLFSFAFVLASLVTHRIAPG